jgi:hypothetical protein
MTRDKNKQLTVRVISAARALTGVGQAEFAAAAGLSVEVLRSLEASGSAWIEHGDQADGVEAPLPIPGVVAPSVSRVSTSCCQPKHV